MATKARAHPSSRLWYRRDRSREDEMVAPAPPIPDSSPESTQALGRTIDDIPIIVLPDDVDVEALLAEFAAARVAEAEAAAAAAATPPLPVPAPRPFEPAPQVSLEEIAENIEDEIEEEIRLEADRGPRVVWTRVAFVAAWLFGGALGVLLFLGWPYYRLAIAERPFHFLHDLLRPSGILGLSLGIAGTATIVASLAYLVRKFLVSRMRSGAGAMPGWLRFHITTGLLGPALVIFHTGFRPTSALGTVALVTLGIVVASGALGRYLLIFIPRTFQGREVELGQIQRRLVVYRRKLEELGVKPRRLASSAPDRSGVRLFGMGIALLRVFYGDWQDRKEFKELREGLRSRSMPRAESRRILILFRRLHRERQWLVRSREFSHLVGAWRFFHRWLAIVMLAAVAFHIAVALRFGGMWIVGGGD